MKTTLTILFAFIVSAVAMGQSKPRKVLYKHSKTITTDSVAYLPDTIPVFFKELPLNEFGVPYEKWQKGFVIWQTWVNPFEATSGTIWYSHESGTLGMYKQPDYDHPLKRTYQFDSVKDEKFLYFDRSPVTNKVIYVLERKAN